MIGKILIGVAAWELGWYALQCVERRGEYRAAKAAAELRGKPLLVVGNPHGQYGCGDVVLDLESSPECPDQVIGSVENMPFEDKQFGAAFVSHVVEHACFPQQALDECLRVADEVFVTYPWWWRLTTLVTPGHAWIITKREDGSLRFVPWRGQCNVPGYFGTGDGGETRT